MKKTLCLLMAIALLVCCIPVGVFAEEASSEASYYVAGSEGLCDSNWSNNDVANQMTLNDDGLYEKVYTDVPAGSYEFKVTDGTWDNCWPAQNYILTVDKLSDVTILFNESTKEVTVDMVEVTGA